MIIKFFEKIFSKKDELIGLWENYDDGSGFHTMVWGYGIEFLENNKGYYHFWGSGEDSEDGKDKIFWKRVDKTSIEIKFIESDESKIISYTIKKIKCGYNNKYYQISEIGNNTFWISNEPLYKKRKF